jgi:hypothetical protein
MSRHDKSQERSLDKVRYPDESQRRSKASLTQRQQNSASSALTILEHTTAYINKMAGRNELKEVPDMSEEWNKQNPEKSEKPQENLVYP